jgi:hypothetical protein
MNIVMKLPYRLRERWRRIMYKITKADNPVKFEDLVNYVKDEVFTLKQPLFSSIDDAPPGKCKETLKNKTLIIHQ